MQPHWNRRLAALCFPFLLMMTRLCPTPEDCCGSSYLEPAPRTPPPNAVMVSLRLAELVGSCRWRVGRAASALPASSSLLCLTAGLVMRRTCHQRHAALAAPRSGYVAPYWSEHAALQASRFLHVRAQETDCCLVHFILDNLLCR